MSERKDITEDAGAAAQKLRSIEEFTTEPLSPPIAEFARFLADRIDRGTIAPLGFLMAANLSLYDLQKGVNGFTSEPIRNGLVDRTPEFYTMLTANIPGLARLAFSETFADAVDEEWQVVLDAMGAERKQTPKAVETTNDPDIIQASVVDISQANHQIIEDAINRTMTLDWRHFGVTNLVEARNILNATAPLTLRNADMNFQLNLLHVDYPGEAELLDSLPSDQKVQHTDEVWLAMLSGSIEPEEATFMRDWLWMKGPEAIASIKKLPSKRVLDHFIKTNPAFERAIFRAARYMQKRGNTPLI